MRQAAWSSAHLPRRKDRGWAASNAACPNLTTAGRQHRYRASVALFELRQTSKGETR